MRVTLNRPEALNALDDDLSAELGAIWKDFDLDDAVEVTVVTGSGSAFCAGADLKTFIPKWEKAGILDVRRNAASPVVSPGACTEFRNR